MMSGRRRENTGTAGQPLRSLDPNSPNLRFEVDTLEVRLERDGQRGTRRRQGAVQPPER